MQFFPISCFFLKKIRNELAKKQLNLKPNFDDKDNMFRYWYRILNIFEGCKVYTFL